MASPVDQAASFSPARQLSGQVIIDSAFFDPEGLGDLQNRQALLSQDPRPRGRGFGCAWLTPGVDTALLGDGDAGSLSLLRVLQLDFGDAE